MVDRNETGQSTRRTRRRMLTNAVGLSAVAGVGLARATYVRAQDATPVIGGNRGGTGCGVPLKTAVDFKSVEGQVIAKITATKLTDPFTGYNPSYPPPRGNRFILLSVNVENVGPNVLQFDPGRIFLQDTDGFVIYPTSVDLGPEPPEPGLTYQEIPPATSASGVVGYVLVQGVMPHRAFFSPSGDRMVLVADLA